MNLSQSNSHNNQVDELTRKKILAILGHSKQILCMGEVRIYTTNNETDYNQENTIPTGNEWLYSNLEGILCYILDTSNKSRYLRLFEPVTFQILFHAKIYQNFSNFYYTLDNKFHCFEYSNIFIGLYFFDESQANNFSLTTKKLNDQIVQIMLDSENKEIETRKGKKEKFHENIINLKKKLKSEDKYSHEYCEDVMEIHKPIFYDLLNFMSYDREKKEFNVGNVPKEFRNLFKNIGIKKKQLKKADTTLNFFKYFIESFALFDDPNARKISNLSDDSDDDEETNDSGIFDFSKDSKKSSRKNTKEKEQKSDIPKAPIIPNAPKINIPTAPKVIFSTFLII